MIKHQSTTAFRQADAVSRLIGFQTKTSEDILVANTKAEKEVHRVLDDSIDRLPATFKAIKETTETHKTLREVRSYLSAK